MSWTWLDTQTDIVKALDLDSELSLSRGVDQWGGQFSMSGVWDDEHKVRRIAGEMERVCYEQFVEPRLHNVHMYEGCGLEKWGRVQFYPKNAGFATSHHDEVDASKHLGVIVIIPPEETPPAEDDVFLETPDQIWRPRQRGYRIVYIPRKVKRWVGDASRPVKRDRFLMVVRVFARKITGIKSYPSIGVTAHQAQQIHGARSSQHSMSNIEVLGFWVVNGLSGSQHLIVAVDTTTRQISSSRHLPGWPRSIPVRSRSIPIRMNMSQKVAHF